MELMHHGILMSLVIGGLAGWIAGLVMRGSGFGVLVDILVGIVGGVVGDWLFGLLHITLGAGLFGSLLTSVIGAVALLFVIRLFRRR